MQIKACFAVAALAAMALAQTPATFKARLSPVPLDMSMFDTIAGNGQAMATITGAKINISGSFEGLRSSATIAQVHRSPVAGVRGPVVFDLTVDKGLSGKVSGSFDLSSDQVTMLRTGKLYIQIHSEKAPDGNLWGWLLP